jgi:hypothetical protein
MSNRIGLLMPKRIGKVQMHPTTRFGIRLDGLRAFQDGEHTALLQVVCTAACYAVAAVGVLGETVVRQVPEWELQICNWDACGCLQLEQVQVWLVNVGLASVVQRR